MQRHPGRGDDGIISSTDGVWSLSLAAKWVVIEDQEEAVGEFAETQ